MTQDINDIVKRSGSSFYWAMRILPKAKREAMFAIYAFCREVDDIADESAPLDEKLKGLADWRNEIEAVYEGTPKNPIAVALVKPVKEFNLEKKEFIAMIDGMAMDVPDGIKAPSMEELELYCRRVAGAVGMLSVRVFGCSSNEADTFAEATGEALQLTNILRDMPEDAEMNRLYMPKELLESAGITSTDPKTVLAHPDLHKARKVLAEVAEKRFAEATEALKKTDTAKMKPAVIMMRVYKAVYDELKKRGWDKTEPRPHVSTAKKLSIIIKTLLGI
ncbi:MAG: presqualene diphosphate synthase HpnD [Alphaproteobacteria bacterium]|nr:presqualene diphosphate synthase HpnD [Alphaproteobacteria bacterium]